MRKILCIVLSLAMIFTYAFAVPSFAGTAKLKTVKITKTDYDIKDGVTMKWKGVIGAKKYFVIKNGKKIKTVKATKKNFSYKFNEDDKVYNGDLYSVAAVKSVKQKQYYNKKTKKWQTEKPAKKSIGKTRYKKVAKVFATSATLPIKYNSGDNGDESPGTAINIQYYTDDKSKITGYKCFDITDTHYFDISNNEDVKVSSDFWKEFISDETIPAASGNQSLLKYWATIGDAINRQYSGYRTYWGSYTNDYCGKYNNRLNYLVDMAEVTGKTRGGKSRDNMQRSGLMTAGSFSEVREKMAQQIKNRIDHNALDGEYSKILSNSKLSVLNDKTPRDIVYVVGTNIDENTKYGNKYKYSSHAILFYDFTLEPVIDNNLEVVTDLSGCTTVEEALATNKVSFTDSDKVVYTNNDNINPTTMSKTSGSSYSNSLSTTITNSETVSFGQSLNITGKGGLKLPFLAESKLAVSVGFTWGESYASAQSNGETRTETQSDQQTVTVTVPAQTALGVREQTEDLNCIYGFKTPMRITYKVCIADIVGQVYADDAVTCNFKSYDQGAFATFFGDGGNNGENAIDSLYLRAEKNIDNPNYDNLYGRVYTSKNKDEWYDEGVKWKDMTDSVKKDLNRLIHNQPMLSNGGMIHLTSEGTKYTVGEPVPLYKLDVVILNKSKREYDQEVNVSVGDNYVINNKIKLDAYNRNGVIYPKFLQGEGKWVACDKNGNEISDAKNGLFSINEKNILTAKKAGSGFITYRLTDKAKELYVSKEGGQTVNPGEPCGNNDVVLSAPIVSVNIE